MLKFCSLFSGSSGNSFFVKNETTNILIDIGVSAKKLETALRRT
jgi:phosphoribosyl 1,2-cyclic phosphodiesterase